MTNPNNIVRVRARNGGRASVYEANGWAQAYSAGLVEGNGVIQDTPADMNVLVGGSPSKPDVILAENPSGYRIALDIIGQQPIAITTPASNSRISAIVAYTDDLSLATTEDTVTGSPASCGLIVVNGTAANSPVPPTDAQIRTAITADGATGSQAAYCVIATILVASNTTVISNSLITINNVSLTGSNIIESANIKPASVKAANIDFTTFGENYTSTEQDTGFTWVDGSKIYKKTIDFGAMPNTGNKRVNHNISNLSWVVKVEGMAYRPLDGSRFTLPYPSNDAGYSMNLTVTQTEIIVGAGIDRTDLTQSFITVYYTKSS